MILNDNTNKKNNDYIYRIVISFHDFIFSHETNPASFFSFNHNYIYIMNFPRNKKNLRKKTRLRRFNLCLVLSRGVMIFNVLFYIPFSNVINVYNNWIYIWNIFFSKNFPHIWFFHYIRLVKIVSTWFYDAMTRLGFNIG